MFSALIFAIDSCCTRASIAALLVALYVERFRFWFTKRLSRWSQRWRTAVNGVRLLVFDWLHHLGSRNRALPPFRRGWNRTPRHIEEQIVQLHVAHPQLGAGQLKLLVERILGVVRAWETVPSSCAIAT